MENQKLPNATVILVLGIVSILGCCCYGIPGLICGIIALVLASKAEKIYRLAPENYSDYGNVKAGKIMAIIGIILSVITIVYIIWVVSFIGLEALQDPELLQKRMMEMQGME
ncbi:MAG: CCC motif membrane protein [Aquaticitalea sp.]